MHIGMLSGTSYVNIPVDTGFIAKWCGGVADLISVV